MNPSASALAPAPGSVAARPLGWLGIVRLGLVQACLGAVVALTTSTLNRVMVVEMGLVAAIPAALVALHYVVQLSRPNWGHVSDGGGRRTPWIVGGMGMLCLGAILATDAALMWNAAPIGAAALAILAFTLIGMGAGASGTSLLALLATRVAPERRPAAASITWILMIVGIVVSSMVVGQMIKPFSNQALAFAATAVAGVAFLVTLAAVHGVETAPESPTTRVAVEPEAPRPPFRQVIAEIWAEPLSRRFALFVFVAMLAYSMQDLILEPFAGLVFKLSPGESTQMGGVQHMGVLLGMILTGAFAARSTGGRPAWMKTWTAAGCLGSALALSGLAAAALAGPGWPLAPTVFALGFANGVFAVAAIGSMMGLAGAGAEKREGARVGVWGAAQAIAFGLGGFTGAVIVDVMRGLMQADAPAFVVVFAIEAALFLAAAVMALRLAAPASPAPSRSDFSPTPDPARG